MSSQQALAHLPFSNIKTLPPDFGPLNWLALISTTQPGSHFLALQLALPCPPSPPPSWPLPRNPNPQCLPPPPHEGTSGPHRGNSVRFPNDLLFRSSEDRSRLMTRTIHIALDLVVDICRIVMALTCHPQPFRCATDFSHHLFDHFNFLLKYVGESVHPSAQMAHREQNM